MWFWLRGESDGHIQSLVIGGTLLVLGVLTVLMGILADLIGTNRKLLEATLLKVRQLEEYLDTRSDVPPAEPDAEAPSPDTTRKANRG